MLATVGILILSLLVAIAFRSSSCRKNNRKLVPSGPPFKLPFLGHLLFLGSEPQKQLLKWSKNYGSVFRIQLGSFETVVINDSRLIRKAFNSSALAGRPRMTVFYGMGSQGKDMNFSDGDHVWDHRQFTHESLKDATSSSLHPLEHRILEEVDYFVAKLKGICHDPVQIHGFSHRVIFNILVDVLMTAKFHTEDTLADELVQEIQSLGEVWGMPEILAMFIPKLYTAVPQWSGLRRRVDTVSKIHAFFDGIIQRHEATLVKGQPRDILDAYLEKSQDLNDRNPHFHLEAGHLKPYLFDLLVGGMEPTSTQLEWIIYYMAKYPEIQSKVQDEIDSFVGTARRPCWSDRTSLTYTEAVLQEILRISSLLPLALFHSALEDYELNGYLIPKNTTVIANLYAAHHDPAVWGDPEAFRPERFIDNVTGQLKRSNEIVIPFGCGKRRCGGEDVARHLIFLISVSVFQQFRVEPADGGLPPAEGYGLSVAPRPFRVVVTSRM